MATHVIFYHEHTTSWYHLQAHVFTSLRSMKENWIAHIDVVNLKKGVSIVLSGAEGQGIATVEDFLVSALITYFLQF